MPKRTPKRAKRADSKAASVDSTELSLSSQRTNINQLLLRAFFWVDEGLQCNLRERGGPAVTHAESMIILTIGEGISRPTAIAERLGVSRQAVHLGLRKLIRVGLVDLVPDPADGRAKVAVLSSTGEPEFLIARGILRELEEELGRRIGTRTLQQLRRALERDWGQPAELGAKAPTRRSRNCS